MTITAPTEVVIYVPTQGASIGYTTEDGTDAEVAALHRPDPRRRADDAAREGDPLRLQGKRGDARGVHEVACGHSVISRASSWFLPLPARSAAPRTATGSAYGRDAGGERFSPLDAINRENVASLEVAWTFRTGDAYQPKDGRPTAFEATPLYVDGTLYLSTPLGRVIALDPVTGQQRWAFDAQGRRATKATATSRAAACRLWQRGQRTAHLRRHHRRAPHRARCQDRAARFQASATAAPSISGKDCASRRAASPTTR